MPTNQKKHTLSELISVISKLNTYSVVLEAELMEIEGDIIRCKNYSNKYGEHWNISLKRLFYLKREKENQLKDVNLQMELFNLHLESGKELTQRLEEKQPILLVKNANTSNSTASSSENNASTPFPDSLTKMFEYVVISPILHHSIPNSDQEIDIVK